MILFDVHGEYANALADRARTFCVEPEVDSRELPFQVPYWALAFDELLHLSLGVISDDATLGAVRDKVIALKRASHESYPISGINTSEITADTPIPFSIHQLWFDLHCEAYSTHTAPPSGQNSDTAAFLLDDNDTPIQEGDALAVIPPIYRPASQAAGQEKIYLSGSNLKIRSQVDALGSRLRDRRYDFLFRPGKMCPSLDGQTKEDLDKFLFRWVGSK